MSLDSYLNKVKNIYFYNMAICVATRFIHAWTQLNLDHVFTIIVFEICISFVAIHDLFIFIFGQYLAK